MKQIPSNVLAKGTITGLRVSAVDGTAFVDNLFDSDADAQIARIVADGGTVVNAAWLCTLIKTMKAQGIYTSTKFIGDANAAVKKNAATGAVATLYDLSGNNNDAIAAGASVPVWSLSGGKGIITTGATGYFDLPDSASWNFGTGDFTILGRVNVGSGVRGFFGIGPWTQPHSALSYVHWSAGKGMALWVYDNSGAAPLVSNTTAYGDGSFHSLGARRIGNSFTVFGDSVVSPPVTTFTGSVGTTKMRIAHDYGSTLLNGIIGSFAVFNAGITDAQITAFDATYSSYVIQAIPSALVGGTNEITIYDSTGKFIRGVLGAVGTGETYTNLVTTDMESGSGDPWVPTGWNAYNASSGELTQDAATFHGGSNSLKELGIGGIAGINKIDLSMVDGALYRRSMWLKRFSGSMNFTLRDNPSATAIATTGVVTVSSGFADWSERVTYLMARQTSSLAQCWMYVGSDTHQWNIDDISLDMVLTPSSLGATIVSAKGGATQNFSYKDVSFTYNAASYYVVIKKLRG